MEYQCCAALNQSRCTNTVIEGEKHCTLHHHKAMKLYKRYKKLSEAVKLVDINEHLTDLKFIMRHYKLLNDTYNARMAHRLYAFVPECYDNGHDFQFVKLQKNIAKCEKLLEG